MANDRNGRLRCFFGYIADLLLERGDYSSYAVSHVLAGLFNEVVGLRWDKRQRKVPSTQIIAVHDYLMKNRANDVTLLDLLSVARLSRSHLFETFSHSYGLSPIAYLIRSRIGRARLYLSNSNKRNKEIAMLCGFRSMYYFCRVFKQHTGMSPGKYRIFESHQIRPCLDFFLNFINPETDCEQSRTK